MIATALTLIVGALLLGAWVYCGLSVIAARHYLAGPPVTTGAAAAPMGISVLKPLAGAEDNLEANLTSFFKQDYSLFELIFAVRHHDDASLPIVERLIASHPQIRSRILVTGEPPYANAKVFSLQNLVAAATHDVLVMSDSDVSVPHGFLKQVAQEIEKDTYDLASCPYRAVPGKSAWSRLEAIGLNTALWSGAFVARMIEGVRFTVGPTVIARRMVFDRIPWNALSAYLAEDFMLGQLAAQQGLRVDFSRLIVDHHIGSHALPQNFAHRARWMRSTRRSRPWGYLGIVFTNPVPLALLLTLWAPSLWPVIPVTAIVRAAAAFPVSESALDDPLCRKHWWLIPLEDLLAFCFWLAGFFGNTIAWRGRRYLLKRDGTFELIA